MFLYTNKTFHMMPHRKLSAQVKMITAEVGEELKQFINVTKIVTTKKRQEIILNRKNSYINKIMPVPVFFPIFLRCLAVS